MVKYIKGLDTIRAVAIILVILDHWNDRLPYPDLFSVSGVLQHIIIPTGKFGVDLFFVLSGFLITSILLKEKNNQTPVGVTLKNFYFRRALRIFPIYYLSILFLFVINYPDIRRNILWLLSYTENIEIYRNHGWNAFSHAWSLSVEEQFYFVWPWIILLIPTRLLKHAMISFVIIGIMSKLWVYKMDHGFDFLLVSDCFDAFGLGGLYAYVATSAERLRKFGRYLSVCFVLALIAYFYWKFAQYFNYLEHLNFLSRTVNSIIALSIIHYVVQQNASGKMKPFFENETLIKIGAISYGLYLYHYPIDWLYEIYAPKTIRVAGALITNYYVGYCIKLLMLLVVAHLSYKYIENPILSLKKKFEYKKPEVRVKAVR